MTELVECNTQLHKTLQGLWSDALTQHKLQQQPTYAILCLFISSSFVNDLVNEEFMFASNQDGVGGVEGSAQEEVIVVFKEWLDFGCVEDWERVWRVWEVKCYCGVAFVS